MSDREVSFVNQIRQGEEIPTHIDSNSLTTGFFFFFFSKYSPSFDFTGCLECIT